MTHDDMNRLKVITIRSNPYMFKGHPQNQGKLVLHEGNEVCGQEFQLNGIGATGAR